MPWHDEITLKLPSPHGDEPQNLRQDILDELEDHLECAMQRELRHDEDLVAARRRVLSRFGSPARIARRLWLDAMKGRLMNQRIMLGTNVVLAAVTITMCVIVLLAVRDSTRAQESVLAELQQTMTELSRQRELPPDHRTVALIAGEEDPATNDDEHTQLEASWAERLALLTDNWRAAYAAGNELVALPPEIGFTILRDNWDRIEPFEARQQIIKAFAFSAMREMHPHIIDVMDLGMSDDSPEVQSWAIGYLRWMAFEDFARDFSAYEKWRERHTGKSAQQTIIDSMHNWTGRLSAGYHEAIELLQEQNMLVLRDQPWMREAARASDLPDVLAKIIESGREAGDRTQAQEHAIGAIRRLREMRADESYMRRVIIPIISDESINDQLVLDAIKALEGERNTWAIDLVLELLARAVTSGNRRTVARISVLSMVIGSYNDPRVIPALIELIEADETGSAQHIIGRHALGTLTGVQYDRSYDAAWWREWWANNRHRFALEAANRENAASDDQPHAEDAQLTIRMTDAHGEPADGIAASLHPVHPPDAPAVAQVTSDTRGTARIANVPPGIYRLKIRGRDGLTGVRRVSIRQDMSRELDVSLPQIKHMSRPLGAELHTRNRLRPSVFHVALPAHVPTDKEDGFQWRAEDVHVLVRSDGMISRLGEADLPRELRGSAKGRTINEQDFHWSETIELNDALAYRTSRQFDAFLITEDPAAEGQRTYRFESSFADSAMAHAHPPDGPYESIVLTLPRPMPPEFADQSPADAESFDCSAVGGRLAGGQDAMCYILHGIDADRNPPEDGYRLLLVLPGGDGSADFHHFVGDFRTNALGEDWLVAQLIAPVWEPENPNRIVWPSRQLHPDSMAFPTEDFIKAVVDDVKQHTPINETHLYALGWSSGGPAIYTAAMAEDSPLTGAFVAMSVFHRRNMPDVETLKTQRFYILHSPDDFIDMRFPKAARETLEELGAAVHLETYDGGHGWHGDAFGMIRHGIDWLVRQSRNASD